MSSQNIYISKSRFVSAEQCQKLLWLKLHKKDAISKPAAAQQYVFDQGNEIGDLACQLFSGGVEITNTFEYEQMAQSTRDLMEQGCRDIYEATFFQDGMLVMVDILHQNDRGEWEIYEVKSSTGVKEVYILDAAYQYMVLKQCGIEAKGASIVHIDKSYVRQGALDLSKLFAIVDVTDQVIAWQDEVAEKYQLYRQLLTEPNEPDIAIGEHCFYPYECPSRGYCWAHIDSPSAFDLVDLVKAERFPADLPGIERGSLYDGAHQIAQISSSDLNYRQKRQHDALTTQNPYVNEKKIREILPSGLEEYHILKLHFTSNGIPKYDGDTPFKNVAYGFSLATYRNNQQSSLHHFLADTSSDMNVQVDSALKPLIVDDLKILVYHNSFQIGAAKNIPSISNRLINMERIFANLNYYDASFLSDFSLQSVIRHFDAGMKQQNEALVIRNDDEAQYAFRFREDRSAISADLEEYGEWLSLSMKHLKQIL